MKTKAFILALSLVLLMSTSVIADVPDQITYQGRLLYNGSPVTSATNITFRLYDAESGTLRWTQGPQSVTPDSNGIYTVILGSVGNKIPDDYDELWLELMVAGNPLTPRKKLTSAPFVLRAGTLPDLYVSGNVGIGTTVPSRKVTVKDGEIRVANNGNGLSLVTSAESAGVTLKYDSVNDGLSIDNAVYVTAGNVGIGTTSPGYKISFGPAVNNNILALAEETTGAMRGIGAIQGAGQYGIGFWASLAPITPGMSNTSIYVSANNGFVGIGTTNPMQTLHVNGAIRLNNGRIDVQGGGCASGWAQIACEGGTCLCYDGNP